MSGTVYVGPGQEYTTISAAIAAATAGETIDVAAGDYINDTATIQTPVTLQAVGGAVNMIETRPLPNQKGILVADASATIIGFSFYGAEIPADEGNNGAAIRYEAGNLTLQNDNFADNQDGLLATPFVSNVGTIDVENSEFGFNGAGDGQSGNIRVDQVAKFIFDNSYSHDSNDDPQIRSLADITAITNSRIYGGASDGAEAIALPSAGNAVISNNTIEQGPDSLSPDMIAYGGTGTPNAKSSLTVSNNTFVNATTIPNPVAVLNADTSLAATVTNSRTWGLTAAELTSGKAHVTGDTILGNEPTLDMSTALAQDPSTVGGATPGILTVGPGEEFSTIGDAVAAAVNGDTIDVQAGVYVNDTATINASITLQAVGGIVVMAQTQPLPNEKGILVADASATINGFEFTGAEIPDYEGNNGAGIRYENGNLTLNNDYFYDDQDGVLATPWTANTGTVDVENSEFYQNGAGDGYSHNIYVNNVADFIFNDSYSHGAVVGHEIKSRADVTTITNSRIEDGATGTSSYSIDLPNAGVATISNDVIEQGPDGQNPIMIAYGEEGNQYANSSLTISDDTIVNDMTSGTPLGLWNTDPNVTAFLSNNSIWGLPQSQLYSGNVAESGDTMLAARPTLDTASYWQDMTGTTAGGGGVGSLQTGAGSELLVGGAVTDPTSTAASTMLPIQYSTGGGENMF